MPACLYIFSGLPGSGKSTLAQRLATHLSATYLRIDTIEQGLRELCAFNVQGEGYRLSYRIAADNLRLGLPVIADSCNPIELTRQEWRQVAKNVQKPFLDIEILCSDTLEHRSRVETRLTEVPGLKLPTWADVVAREYHPWSEQVIRIDTAGSAVDSSFAELVEQIELQRY